MRLSLVAITLAFAATATQALTLPDFKSPFDFEPLNTDLIKPCGNESDTLKIEYINISPDPPKAGQVLKIDAKGTLEKRIENSSTIEVLVKLGLIKLVQLKLDFCEESAKVGKPCPLEPGEHTLQHEVELPKEIPPGIYRAHVVVMDQDLSQVTCLNAQVTFKPTIPKF
ncbi:Phosphatidylglycerol/phosphatidylinositol transfer protein [Actinomortierella wolfii]|nr:Phosphatidylglycerol/phosphatidylinositol transfer protein [Actinomortierella wolfii]